MPSMLWGPLRVDTAGNREAILLSHGGYTPRRDFLRRGSGKTAVPAGLTVQFYSEPDAVTIGTKGLHLLSGFAQNVVQSAGPHAIVENYSLVEDEEKFRNLEIPADARFDVIRIREGKKAHLKDIWAFLGAHSSVRWNVLHYFACRINKRTYSDEIVRLP